MVRTPRAAPVAVLAAALAATFAGTLQAQRLTSPREHFGHDIGADYVLPNYQQMVAYWQKLDGESDRMTMVNIGTTAEGRPQYMAIVTSPENHRDLERWRLTAQRLARAEGVDSAEARRLAREGKAVVWIDGGLHANEVLGAQQLIETSWQLVSRTDEETTRILDDVVILMVHANPDGMDLVSDWYMREQDPQRRTIATLPRLYQKYIGHDNNRDFYASTQAESENMNRVMYRTWYPQVMYNHHQTGPTGTVMFAPPFRDPFNYVYDPLIVTGLDLVGAAMHNRFVAEEKPGVTMRRGANYSTWWNGGLRTTAYFHNMIGLLTETIGSPTPMNIPFVANRQIANADLPYPIEPQRWHFRRSIDYSVTANYAVLDVASRYRETFLYNIWKMASNAIERGEEDHWTVYPRRVDAVREAMRAAQQRTDADGMAVGGLIQGAADPASSARFMAMLRTPELRDPRGYILPSDQPDFPTAVKFVNALLETGVEVHRASASFQVGGKTYPAGSFVIRTAQAYRPHVLDMFEPQDHPNDFRFEGGPPIPPYDNAGWTLAFQMGVQFDRILDAFDGPFVEVTEWNTTPPAGRVAGSGAGWVLSPKVNDAFAVVNRVLAEGGRVYRLPAGIQAGGRRFEPGAFWIDANSVSRARVGQMADSLGVSFTGAGRRPSDAIALRPVRIALWDRYGGSMPSGWTRWLFEQFKFPFTVVYPQELDAGDLNAKYDVIVLVSGAVPSRDPQGGGGQQIAPESVPEEFRGWLGNVTVARTVPQLRSFLENGGTVVTVGSSSNLARHLGLPVDNFLMERAADGQERPLPADKFYIPGSLVRMTLDPSHPSTWGMDPQVDVMFDNSPVFRLGAGAEQAGLRRIGWYQGTETLRSGWAWGQDRLDGGVGAVSAQVGRGTLYLFGPEVTFRAQPHGTFKLLFNAIYGSVQQPAR